MGLGIFHATGHGGRDAHAGHEGHAALPPASDNPIKDEMADLALAFDTLNRAVILGDPAGVSEAFHRVHAREAATAAALAAGTVRPPRNGEPIDAFIAEDEAFHAIIESTVAAADRGDLPALAERADALRDGCVACHETYR